MASKLQPAGTDYSRLAVIRFRLRQLLDWHLHTTLRLPLAWTLVTFGQVLRRLGARRAGLRYLLKGRRVGPLAKADNAIKNVIASQAAGTSCEFQSLIVSPRTSLHSPDSGRVLILKLPMLENGEVIEKGALVIKFTETFAPFFHSLDIHALARHFRIILEPSWVGYSLPEILIWTGLAPEKVVVMAPYGPDYDLLTNIGSNLVPITVGPADWGNPETFRPIPGTDKIYDCVSIANYKATKRVDRFVRAVVRVSRRRPEFRAALICAGVGRSTSGREVASTIEWGRRRSRLDFLSSCKQPELNELFNKSKVNVLMSLREGANKGLAEGLFAGTPALLIAESACGNHRHINAKTGLVVSDAKLEDALEWFALGSTKFDPRGWAMENISPRASTAALSALLRKIELAEGRRWTKDLMAKANQPEMRYLDRSDEWLLAERTQLFEIFCQHGKVNPAGFLSRLSLQLISST
jgi:hypothetical protein